MTARQSAALKARFLERFRVHGNVSWACREAGITRRTVVYRWQELDDAFAAAYRQAELEATETLEAEAFRRAVDGVEEPVYQQGQQVGAVRKFSGPLLITLLRARAPEKYAERRKVEHAGAVGVEHGDSLSPEEREAIRRAYLGGV